MRWTPLIAALLLAATAPARAAPGVTVAVNSAHGAVYLIADFAILKPGVTLGSQAVIDRSVCDPTSTVFDTSFVADATSNASFNFFPAQDGNDCGPPPVHAENFVPYAVLNQSFSDPPPWVTNYLALEGANATLSLPYLGACAMASCAFPGIYSVNTTSPAIAPPAGNSVEFLIANNYKGFNTGAASWVTAAMAAIYAAIRYDHPSWTAADVTGALRQTAAHWSSGYSVAAYGYGTVDVDAADALSSASAIYLEPPALTVENFGYYARITLYPFRQTRRLDEAVYSVNPAYVWPVKNEYTAADIAASGATLLYTSNGSDVTPTFTYAPAASGTVTLVAFTADGAGGYSRVESFSEVPVTFTVSGACTN